jgi:23S rRNA U2552 (ribose-2'-O)-methylase RlmE/FtsJ
MIAHMTTATDPEGTRSYFLAANHGRYAHKFSNYFDVYDAHLARFREKSPRILEIGVQHGGSLLLWDAYFEESAKIVGIDILPECKKFESESVRIYIGDQSDENFLRSIVEESGQFDIIIDDGSHIPRHQIKSFEYLFYNGLKNGGVYICEDCHSSYWPSYGGGLRRRGTFIEYAKRLCDQLNAWLADDKRLSVNRETKHIKSVAFYSSMVVIDKAEMSAPHAVASGESRIDLEAPFKTGRLAPILIQLKRNPIIQRLVRNNDFLWKLMRKRI